MAVGAVRGITLNDGNTIPQLGFGVFLIEPNDTSEAVEEALEIGYRHIDTAEMYANEKEVGEAVRAYGREHGIATEAWSPIARGAVLDDSTITEIAEKVGKTPAQIILRWHIQRSDIVFPKSVTPSRMKENFEIFDFELASEDMEAITALDRSEDGRVGPHPDKFDVVPS
jgi:diketogulonate reductase-like aldo/keto reductase